jgi:uncharacterized membrane protein YdbT with pleckstrin-like domain
LGAKPTQPSPVAGGLRPDEPEQELWKGGLSWLALAHLWLLWILWTSALLFVYFKWMQEWSPILGTILMGLVALPFGYIVLKFAYGKLAIRYRLTSHRLFKQVGILSRKLNELELIRVDDVAVEQNVIQRLFDVGTVTIIAPTDNTDPRLEIYGVDSPLPLKEKIREHVRKRRERIVNMQSL